jgi:hypothetical protein
MAINPMGTDICVFCKNLEIEENDWDAVEYSCKFSDHKKTTDKCPIFERRLDNA